MNFKISTILLLTFFILSCKSKNQNSVSKVSPELGGATVKINSKIEGNQSLVKVEIVAPKREVFPDTSMIVQSYLTSTDKREKQTEFYNNLVSDGYTEAKIGKLSDFLTIFRDTNHMLTLYTRLMKEGYTVQNLGSREKYLRVLYYQPYDVFDEIARSDKKIVFNFIDSDGYITNSLKFPLNDFKQILDGDNIIIRLQINFSDSSTSTANKIRKADKWEIEII